MSEVTTATETRTWFSRAASGFLAVANDITAEQLTRPALGEWDLRALLGHTSRAFSTIESYLAAAPAAGEALPDALSYYRAASAVSLDPREVADRGRQAGTGLGADPVSAVRELAARLVALVDVTPDDAQVATLFGPMRLIDYLATRAFELTVHGIDIARALGRPIPPDLTAAARPAIELALDILPPQRLPTVLDALTGRSALPKDIWAL